MPTSRALATAFLATLLLTPAALLLSPDSSGPAAHSPDAKPSVNDVGTGSLPAQRLAVTAAGYLAAAGTELTYDLRFELELGVRSGQPEDSQPTPPPLHVTAAGPMQLVVLGRRAHEVLVGYRTAAVVLTLPATAPPATLSWAQSLQQALQQGFDVRMDERGAASAVRFHGPWNGEQRNFARALLRAFQVEFQPAGAWTSDVDDAMGHHRFEYTARTTGDEVAIVRTRAAFVPLGAEGDRKADVQQHGTAEATFAAELQWLSAVDLDDEVAWSWLEGAMRVTTAVRGSLRCTGSNTIAVTADWDRDFLDMIGRNENPIADRDPMRGFWDERLRGRDVSMLLHDLHVFLDSKRAPDREYQELLQMLAELVRRDPTEATRLGDLVQSAQLTGQAAADVLAVLGMAGHEAAQAALTAVFANGLVEQSLRQAAVESMIQLAHPGRQLVDGLRRSLFGASQLTALDGSAMLALGAMSSRGATTTEGQPLVQELLAFESTARRDGLEGAYFEALGNTGDPALLPLAQRLLQSEQPVERARALTVLRRVDSPAAQLLLRSAARDDGDADVRRQAVQTIGESTAAWTRDVLIERAALDGDVEVRRVAYSALALRAHTDPVARTALAQRLAAEPDPELHQMLQSLLGGA